MSHTKALLDGLYKETYGETLESLIPDFGILQKRIPFKTSKRVGDAYVQAVRLTNEAGFTYGAGIQTLAGIESGSTDDARVSGSPLTLQSGFSYDAAAAMSTDKQSFQTYSAFKFKSMMEAASYRLELQMLYGNSGLGVADSGQDSVTAVTNTSQVIIPITAATWAAGIWAGAEGSYVSLFETDSATASAAEGSDSSNTVNKFEVKAVSTANKTITVDTKDGTEAAALVVEIEDEDYDIYFYGATGNEMTGLDSICSNTGTLFSIAGGTYSLWTGNTYAVGAANLTLKKIFDACALAVGKGLMEDVVCLVSPATFGTLSNTEAGLVRLKNNEKKVKRGAKNIEFYGPTGDVEVVPHPMIKEQEAMIFPIGQCSRLGASDLTFNTPGRGGEIFTQMASSTGFETRLYSDQAIFLPCPGKCVKLTGISNA